MDSLTRGEKEQRWKKVAAQVDKITDKLGLPVDEGSKEAVIVLNLLGFRTVQSCEGHADRGVCGPWVDIRPGDIEALMEKMEEAERTLRTAWEEKRPVQELEDHSQALRAAREEVEVPVLHLAVRLMAYLIEFYQERAGPHDRRLVLHEFLEGFRLECHGAFLQEVADLPQREAKLREYQDEMCSFTAFLKERYFAD